MVAAVPNRNTAIATGRRKGTWVGQQSRTYQTWTIVGFLLLHHFLRVNPDDVLLLDLDEGAVPDPEDEFPEDSDHDWEHH